MNVVIDCNIFISAILSNDGMAVEVIKKALEERIIPQFGQKLFNEYEDVLSRDHIIEKSRLQNKMVSFPPNMAIIVFLGYDKVHQIL